MDIKEVCSYVGAALGGFIAIFQVVKTLINNRKFDKLFCNDKFVNEVVKAIDYNKLAVTLKTLMEKNEGE